MEGQFERFLSHDNFKLAFERLGTARRDLYKSLYYDDLKIFGFFLDENIDTLINSIRQNIYSPEKAHKFFIPKKGYFVRPLSLLIFQDLLVYQALANVIADVSYDIISPHYDAILFGNIVNPSDASVSDRPFFYKSWKKRWMRFNSISKESYQAGYKVMSEFDIASFFDTIDHNILCQILQNNFGVEKELLDLLRHCLHTWTADSNHQTFESMHGIPQGPITSQFLADLYLFPLDSNISNIKKYDFKYFRYVDDIRILAKDVITSKKIIATLDLYSRDLGLIPQASKVLVQEVTDIDKVLKTQNSKFSAFVKEYKEDNPGKPARSLKSGTHKKLKKRFLATFISGSDEVYLDKTVISFSLFKLNKDDEVKECILKHYDLILAQFEGVLFYLKSHYGEDVQVIQLIQTIVSDDNTLFHHIIALCFKFFPNVPFDDNLFKKYMFEKHRHWLVNYYMLGWLFYHGKKDLLLSLVYEENHFIYRELNYLKYRVSTDTSFRDIFTNKLMESKNPIVALQGLDLISNSIFLFNVAEISQQQNEYVRYILGNERTDLITHFLKNNWEIEEPEKFFNEIIWNDPEVYNELKTSFLLFIKSKGNDPTKALLNLNIFNNLVFDRICGLMNTTT